ncbi:MAG TPA: EthD family reductase, partial [Chloroflexota bacterium]|nr:EthD family reductase [Chloroflexota bacterium]
MVKLLALYKQPQDVARFEEVYFGQHIPLTKKMPGLRRLEVNRVTGAPRGEPAYYLATSLYFDDAEAMNASLAS